MITEETREKMRQAKLRNPVRYWDGKTRPDIGKRLRKPKMKKYCGTCNREFFVIPALALKRKFCSSKCRPSEFKKGHISANGFKKGMIPWNKGKKYPQITGKKNFNWKGGVTPKNKIERVRFRHTTQKEVFKRDNYTCQMCFEKKGGELSVDHIKSWAKYPELRFDKDNCRTLCMKCHYYVTFGKRLPAGKKWGHNLKMVEGGLAI